jgi:hypothetical protein
MLGSAGEGDAQGQQRLCPHAWAMAARRSAFTGAGGEQEWAARGALLGRPWRSALSGVERLEEEASRGRGERSGGVGSSVSTSGRQGRGRDACREGQARSRAWPTRPGHVASSGVFQRARGSLRNGLGGGRFWASSGPNWTLGQIQSLKPP